MYRPSRSVDHAFCPAKMLQGLFETWWQKFGNNLKQDVMEGFVISHTYFSSAWHCYTSLKSSNEKCTLLWTKLAITSWSASTFGHIFELRVCISSSTDHVSMFIWGKQEYELTLKNTESLIKWTGLLRFYSWSSTYLFWGCTNRCIMSFLTQTQITPVMSSGLSQPGLETFNRKKSELQTWRCVWKKLSFKRRAGWRLMKKTLSRA